MNQEEIKQVEKMIDARVAAALRDYSRFTNKRIADTPNDLLSITNKKFVTANGTTFPNAPVTGQFFFSSVLSTPTWYNGTNWVDPTASVVG